MSPQVWPAVASDTGWITPPLTNGTNVSGNPFGYRLKNGVVYLRGRVTAVTGVMYTFPDGFRPDSGADNVLILDQNTHRVNFKANGQIDVLVTTGSAAISFLGVNFIPS